MLTIYIFSPHPMTGHRKVKHLPLSFCTLLSACPMNYKTPYCAAFLFASESSLYRYQEANSQVLRFKKKKKITDALMNIKTEFCVLYICLECSHMWFMHAVPS